MQQTRKRFSRRTVTLFWMLFVAVVIGALIAYEQISALYVLATLTLVVLLMIVGFADLEGVGRTDAENISPEN
ncbi:MAG: hypothetical protein ACKVQJ_06225 [Pyrinomonadaceae bacterium]